MFAQFRSQFPMGSLLSELLQIHEGKYIVRASVQVGGSTLATGLSAAHTIEQAEDQARSRALVVLGIESPSAAAPYGAQNGAQLNFRQTEVEQLPHLSQARLSAPATQVDFLPMGDSSEETLDGDWALSDSTVLPFPTSEQLSWLEANPHPSASGYESRSNRPYEPKGPRQRPSQPPQRETRPELAFQDSVAAPIDLSEVIAQTDVELKRLGWTHVQGRRYLEKTYSKRSRQHLTDAELIEFLDYLTAQPARGKTAF